MNKVTLTYILSQEDPDIVDLEITREGHGSDWVEEHADGIEKVVKNAYGRLGFEISPAARLD